MQSKAATPDDYISELPDDRRPVIKALRDAINANIPDGFEEEMSYGMIGWVVPKSIYPSGYHCDTKLPLPFINLASQKNHIAVYHMALKAAPDLLDWFAAEWPKHSSKKLDLGKACNRYKKPEDVPVALIGELASKLTPQQWIEIYENGIKPQPR